MHILCLLLYLFIYRQCKGTTKIELHKEKEHFFQLPSYFIPILQNFCKWFKNGLKAQKLPAQGNTLGIVGVSKAPCKGKSFVYCLVLESFCPYYYICTWKNKEVKIFISANFC